MSKKPIRPEWTTTVDPSEYDYVAQFTRMVKLANRHQEYYAPVDVGKVWGLVQSHQNLQRENATLREDKERLLIILQEDHSEILQLRADKERLIIILQDLVSSAKRAMNEANRDGAEWDIKDQLSDAYAALDAARKAQP